MWWWLSAAVTAHTGQWAAEMAAERAKDGGECVEVLTERGFSCRSVEEPTVVIGDAVGSWFLRSWW